jgi:hypothetical protein
MLSAAARLYELLRTVLFACKDAIKAAARSSPRGSHARFLYRSLGTFITALQLGENESKFRHIDDSVALILETVLDQLESPIDRFLSLSDD